MIFLDYLQLTSTIMNYTAVQKNSDLILNIPELFTLTS